MRIKEKDFLRAVRRTDRAFFAEAAGREAAHRAQTAAQKGIGHQMNTENNTHKIRHHAGKFAWGIGLAAALLGAGGITAAVAMRGSNTSDTTKQTSTPDVIEQNSMFALTDQTDTPGMRGLAESENGFYFFKRSQSDSSDKENSKERKTLFYSDKETGEVVWLCNRANCLHDGNEFCVATTSKYEQLVSFPVWFEGYLYTIAQKSEDQSVVLLRYEPDGSAITEMLTLYTGDSTVYESEMQAEIIAHRGYLWYTVSRNKFYVEEDPNLGTAGVEILCDYQLSAYDVTNGQTTVLLSADAQEHYYSLANPINLQGEGNYIYFEVLQASWGEQNGLTTGIWRLSCLTGETEKLLDTQLSQQTEQDTLLVSGDRLFYEQNVTHVSPGGNWHEECNICLYDLTTKEDLFADNPNAPSVEDGNWYSGFTADAEHLILLKQVFPDEDPDHPVGRLSVYDWNGNLQTVEIDSEAEMKQQPELYQEFRGGFFYYMNALRMAHGTLYVKYTYGWYQMSVADALNGNSSLTPAFRHDTGNDRNY